MYKIGLILALITQIIGALATSIVAGLNDSLFGVVTDALSAVSGSVVSSIADTIVWVLAFFSVMYFISIAISSLALNNLSKAENGTDSFNSGIATVAGGLALFTTLIGGILTLVGMLELKNSSHQNRAPVNPNNRRR